MMDLVLRDLSCGYAETPVLSALNLEVGPGEVLAIVGPNGVGKSTLIRAASGSLKPLAGRVSIGGQELALLSDAQRAQRVSVVSQALNLPEAYTVMDVVLRNQTNGGNPPLQVSRRNPARQARRIAALSRMRAA